MPLNGRVFSTVLFRNGIAAVCFCLPFAATATVVVDWNNAALVEVKASRFGAPIVARALAIAHTCMYEAWVAYDSRAIGTVLGAMLRRPASESTDANKAKAISYAGYRCLANLYPAGALARLPAVMLSLGYDPTDLSTDLTTPQGIGNVAAIAIINARLNDGSNQCGNLTNPLASCDLIPNPFAYSDYTGPDLLPLYKPRNPPMPFCLPTTSGPCPVNTVDPNHWQPLINAAGKTQVFVAPFWKQVTPFALTEDSFEQFDALTPVPNFLQGASNYLADVEFTVANSQALDLGRKLIVEYWADGVGTVQPPGHWGLFAQFVSQRDNHSIDQDVQMFFAMHNASFDAGIVGWRLKRKYDGVRPITAARYLAQGAQVLAWGGPGRPIEPIAGEKWAPYNPGDNPTPSFPGYISGHSIFSTASAAVLQAFTGSDDFGYSTVIPAHSGLVEPNVPPVPTTFTYPTFSAAAVEAGQSRLYGGIHFSDDVTVGQTLGTLVGQRAWRKAQFLINGGVRRHR
jgi:hypothetical protein